MLESSGEGWGPPSGERAQVKKKAGLMDRGMNKGQEQP